MQERQRLYEDVVEGAAPVDSRRRMQHAYGVSYSTKTVQDEMFHPEYRRNFRFEGVPLRSGMAEGESLDVLRMIVADSTGEGADG